VRAALPIDGERRHVAGADSVALVTVGTAVEGRLDHRHVAVLVRVAVDVGADHEDVPR